MSIKLKTLLKPSTSGTGAIFNDVTGQTDTTAYGQSGNIPVTDVAAVRIKIATYTTLGGLATLEHNEKFTRYKEYSKTDGEMSTIDGKNFYVGNTFVPRVADLVVPSGDTWVETGYYVYPYLSTWLPTAAQVQNDISLSKLNQTGTAVYDDIYAYTYEIYETNAITTGTISSTAGARYLVTAGTATYDGSTFSPGDSFVAYTTADPIVVTAGRCYKMYASSDAYAVLSFNTKSSLYQLVVENAGASCYKCWSKINNIKTQLDAITFMSETGNVALGPASKTLEWVNDAITNFQTCNC
jgi:hypothetical protein